MLLDTHYPRLLEIQSGHTLEQQRENIEERARTRYETRWFTEHDAQQRLVARYRTWFNCAMDAPWRQQLGWERYSPEGELLVREVRYARGDAPAAEGGNYLH